MLFFENSRCMNCGMTVGYCVELAKIVTLQHQTGSSQGTVYEVFFPNQGLRHYRQCKNARDHDACNWLVPAEEPAAVLQFLPAHGSRARSHRHRQPHRLGRNRSRQAPPALHAVLAQAAAVLAAGMAERGRGVPFPAQHAMTSR